MSVACFVLPQIGIACERTRLVHLWGQPLILTSERGEVLAVSDEAAAYGIRSSISLSAARSLCSSLVALPYDAAAYEAAAHCLWDLFAIESSVVEPVSPELCFVEMDGPDVPQRVRDLARALSEHVRVPVQAGIASSKFVARQAAIGSPQDDTVIVPMGHEAIFLAPLPLDRITGLDFKLRQKLERLGVRRFGDVLKLPPRLLERQFREVGYFLHRLAVGEDGDRVRPLWPPRRISERFAFEEEVLDEATPHEALRRCSGCIARALASRHEFCRSITLVVGLADGSFVQEIEKLGLPTSDAGAIHRAAMRLLRRLRCDRPLAEVQLVAGDLGSGSGVQLALLDDNAQGRGLPHERRSRLDATLAYLRRRFPASAPVLASLLRQARRVGLWTYPLGHMLDRPVQVATNTQGEPARYWSRRHSATVKHVHTRWRETEWFWGSVSERTVWRVETDPAGLCELHQFGVRWRLGAVAD